MITIGKKFISYMYIFLVCIQYIPMSIALDVLQYHNKSLQICADVAFIISNALLIHSEFECTDNTLVISTID